MKFAILVHRQPGLDGSGDYSELAMRPAELCSVRGDIPNLPLASANARDGTYSAGCVVCERPMSRSGYGFSVHQYRKVVCALPSLLQSVERFGGYKQIRIVSC